MRTVLIGWELGAGHGHLERLRPIAEMLLRAGDRVVVASRNPQTCSDLFRSLADRFPALDITRAPYCIYRSELTVRVSRGKTLADVLLGFGFGDRETMRAVVDRWLALLGRVRPDLVISDFSPTLNLVARGKAPVLVTGNGYTIPPADQRMMPIGPWCSDLSVDSARHEDLILRNLDGVAGERGLSRITSLADIFHGTATFPCCLPELDPYRARRKTAVWPPYNVPTARREASRAKQDPDRIFLYLPRTHGLSAAVIRALKRSRYTIDAYLPALALEEDYLTGTVKLRRDPADLQVALSTASLVVHHGGLGMTHAALYAGIPQLMLPANLEHQVTAFLATQLDISSFCRGAVPFGEAGFLGEIARLLSDTRVQTKAQAFAERLASQARPSALEAIENEMRCSIAA